MLIDSHAHLEMGEFDPDRAAVVRRAGDAGVVAVVTVGTTVEDAAKAIDLAAAYDPVFAAVGIHPHEAKRADAAAYDALRAMAAKPKVVAYGEIGLDFHRNHSPRDVQIRCFGDQLYLAADLGLPVIIHDREAHREVMEMLRPWRGRRVVIHCFSGDVAMAGQCLDFGFYLSVDGPVTYPKSDRLADVVRYVPLERLLVETDAPYLTPQIHRGKRNEPAYVVHTAHKVAEIKQTPLEDVERQTTDNAAAFFGIPLPGNRHATGRPRAAIRAGFSAPGGDSP